ncbi:MAG: serine/threonine protein phosphatase [Sphingomonas sp. 28-66-16]|nr:MAG: serine/threonine protein phosphatase [Sphingomonas sp. 28-66-16]
MLKRLRKSIQPASPRGSIPEGLRLYAVGDVHGRIDLLDMLLDLMTRDDAQRGAAEPQLIFLGDLIDRGPDSAAVVDRVIQIKRELPTTRMLMGNHEEVFVKALRGDERALRFFCKIGGRETILSYGITEDIYNKLDYPDLMVALQESVPEEHLAFLGSFEDMVIAGDYAFVHAGIRPDVALADQKPSDLRWIRESFLDHAAPHERIIVHGHSISAEVEMRPNRIGIDTGAYASGRLTALGLQGADTWQIAAQL